MKQYTTSLAAAKLNVNGQTSFATHPFIIRSATTEEAEQTGIKISKKMWPPEDGWCMHIARAIPTSDILDTLADHNPHLQFDKCPNCCTKTMISS